MPDSKTTDAKAGDLLAQSALAVYHGVGTREDERRLIDAGLAEVVTVVRLTPDGSRLARITPAESG